MQRSSNKLSTQLVSVYETIIVCCENSFVDISRIDLPVSAYRLIITVSDIRSCCILKSSQFLRPLDGVGVRYYKKDSVLTII